jgi:ABC-type antimicrobial peptide transport system permease subunit
MAVFGFLALCLLGLWIAAVGVMLLLLDGIFPSSRHGASFFGLAALTLSVGIFWLAYSNAPFTVTIT